MNSMINIGFEVEIFSKQNAPHMYYFTNALHEPCNIGASIKIKLGKIGKNKPRLMALRS